MRKINCTSSAKEILQISQTPMTTLNLYA